MRPLTFSLILCVALGSCAVGGTEKPAPRPVLFICPAETDVQACGALVEKLRAPLRTLVGSPLAGGTIRLLDDDSRYRELGNSLYTAGVFRADLGEVHVRDKRPDTKLVMLHEATHMFLSERSFSVWIDEGLAEYFSHRALERIVPAVHRRMLRRAFRDEDWAEQLIRRTSRGFYSGSQALERCTQVWAFVWYCMEVRQEGRGELGASLQQGENVEALLLELSPEVRRWAHTVVGHGRDAPLTTPQ